MREMDKQKNKKRNPLHREDYLRLLLGPMVLIVYFGGGYLSQYLQYRFQMKKQMAYLISSVFIRQIACLIVYHVGIWIYVSYLIFRTNKKEESRNSGRMKKTGPVFLGVILSSLLLLYPVPTRFQALKTPEHEKMRCFTLYKAAILDGISGDTITLQVDGEDISFFTKEIVTRRGGRSKASFTEDVEYIELQKEGYAIPNLWNYSMREQCEQYQNATWNITLYRNTGLLQKMELVSGETIPFEDGNSYYDPYHIGEKLQK